MKEYESVTKAIIGTFIELNRKGIRRKAGTWQSVEKFKDSYQKVIFNEVFSFPCPENEGMASYMTGCDHEWAEMHFKERISGIPSNPGKSYKIWPYNTFLEENDPYKDGKEFSHTYQERFWPKFDKNHKRMKGLRYNYGDLLDVIKQLRENPRTRQAFLPIFFPEDTGAMNRRIPCTIGYYFHIIKGRLDCTYIIRSCDIFRHFRNDLYLTIRLVQSIAGVLKIQVGDIVFHGFNLHLFESDMYAFNKKEKRINENLKTTKHDKRNNN